MKVLLVLLDVVVTVSVPGQITVLEVSVDIEVIVHVVRIVLLSCGRKILLQLLQLVHGEEVRHGEDDLRDNRNILYLILNMLQLMKCMEDFIHSDHSTNII